MDARGVAVIGGGPGGLYVARLIKLACPSWEVTVYEQNADGRTFGFGVGLTPSTLQSLDEADPDSAADIRRAGHAGHGMEMRVGAGVRLPGGGNIAIGRAVLLTILRTHAVRAGVRMVTAHVDLPDLEADLIVAADGVRSGVREKLAPEFRAQVELDDALYLWAATDFALDHATFAPAHTPHGVLVVHAYPYGPDRSTFLVETDEATWRRAALDVADAHTEEGSSDERSLEYLADAFSDVLLGHRLLGNRTRWQRFATVRCGRWYHNNIALLGDAAHTAHYSIGSGTKLALEDAIALARALVGEASIAAALERYEALRRPWVERFQTIAARSHVWWKNFPRRLDLTPARLMTSYMTRAGNVTVDGFAEWHPDVVADAAAAFGGEEISAETAADPVHLANAVLGSSIPGIGRRVVDCEDVTALAVPLAESVTDPWGPEGAHVVARARGLLEAGARMLWLTGDGDRPAALIRCDLAERLRLDTGAIVGVDLPASLAADAVGALLGARADLVRFR
ncbi:FAD-dependent monooxygenase [Streptomyces sp. NEAU-174]|uniref:FAD-dependent monooxygenase n=1 Tax=Streptomyces sp. NEAU-174 TaxID=3458254 RepID=UPI004044C75D